MSQSTYPHARITNESNQIDCYILLGEMKWKYKKKSHGEINHSYGT